MDDEIILSAAIDQNRSLCITTISRKTYQESDAQVFASERGYFLIERNDDAGGGGISVLGKVASLEAAFRMFDLLEEMLPSAAMSTAARRASV